MEGIVTLEDLLEEIVGEIEDEFDLPDEPVEQIDDHTFHVHGMFPIDDFNEHFRIDLPEEDYHTVAGFVFGLLGHQPEPGDAVSTTASASRCSRSRATGSTGSRSRSSSTRSQRRDPAVRGLVDEDEVE